MRCCFCLECEDLYQCQGWSDCIFRVLNFLLTLTGLAIIGYGIYLLIEYDQSSSANVILNEGIGPFLASVTLNSSVGSESSSAWCIWVFILAGVVLFVHSCVGLIGAITRIWCFLNCYGIFVLLLILIEVGCGTFIICDSSWKDLVPTDSTGYFEDTLSFLKDHWFRAKCVGFLIVVLEVVLYLLSLHVRDNARDCFDRIEYYLRRSARRRQTPPTAPPAADPRNDTESAWQIQTPPITLPGADLEYAWQLQIPLTAPPVADSRNDNPTQSASQLQTPPTAPHPAGALFGPRPGRNEC